MDIPVFNADDQLRALREGQPIPVWNIPADEIALVSIDDMPPAGIRKIEEGTGVVQIRGKL